jgi:5S rRNA maturation endonuclease (ribonuclease M5)
MKNNNKAIAEEIEKYKEFLIIVEGKKDRVSLVELGFRKIFVLNETGKSLYEKIEQIPELAGKDTVCILTDFDKKGKSLYLLLKSKLNELGSKQDNTLRGILLREKVSHIEGLSSFVKNLEEA